MSKSSGLNPFNLPVIIKNLALLSGAILLTWTLSGCEEKGPMEKAGEKADEAMEQAREKIEEGGDKLKEAMEEAGDKVEEATDNLKKSAE